MKTSLITFLISGFLTSGLALAKDFSIRTPETEEEILQIASDLHAMNCNGSVGGWWLQLNSPTNYSQVSGGVSVSSGTYYGCGTCAACRTDLNSKIDQLLSADAQNCISRGGQVKATRRGEWTEDIQTSTWSMISRTIGITCEKWIDCK